MPEPQSALFVLQHAAIPCWVGADAGIIKFGIAIAGFAGSVLSLVFASGLTRMQMFGAVAAGFFSAFYATPLVVHYFDLSKEPADLSYGIAFVLGLLAMNIIPAGKAMIVKRT